MKKRFLSAILTGALLLSVLAGCGSDDGQGDAAPSGTPAEAGTAGQEEA